jgi:hypothetical protein
VGLVPTIGTPAGRQLRVPGSSIMVAGSAHVGRRSPWKRCEVGIVERYARSPLADGLFGAVCLDSPQFLTEVLARKPASESVTEVRLSGRASAKPRGRRPPRNSPARRSPPMAVGRRRLRDTQASMQGCHSKDSDPPTRSRPALCHSRHLPPRGARARATLGPPCQTGLSTVAGAP